MREAVVVLRNGVATNASLIAYLEFASGLEVPEDLRERLALRLPGYMIPGAFISLEIFPMTASGKIDRKALSL